MTKADLVDTVAKGAKISKRVAEEAVDATFEGISRAIKKSKRFQVPGFGTFTGKCIWTRCPDPQARRW